MFDNDIVKIHKELDYLIQIKKLKDVDCILLQFPIVSIRECNISGQSFVYAIHPESIELFFELDTDIDGKIIKCPSYARLAILYVDMVLKIIGNGFHTDLVCVFDDKKLIGGLQSLYRIVPTNPSEEKMEKDLLSCANDMLLGHSRAKFAEDNNIIEGYDIIINIVNNQGI